MSSLLVITSVEDLQKSINSVVRSLNDRPGIYVTLNKTQKSTEALLSSERIKTNRIFFIDCVTSEKTRDDVLHIAPDQLDLLNSAIQEFLMDLKGPKYLIIDALSTLLIYNSSDKVAKFVKDITTSASENNVDFVAFSPKTKGEDFLNKIYNFFDSVEGEK
jgi:hypothetical protein